MSFHLWSFFPIACFAISSAGFFIAVQLPQRNRIHLSPLIFGCAFFSLRTSTHLSWFYQGATSYWNLLICVWMHHASSVLFIEPFHFPHKPMSKQGWTLAYKIWADPQHQLDWSTYLQSRDSGLATARSRNLFALRRIAKIALCWYIELRLINPTVSAYFVFTAADFMPQQEPFIRRILLPYFGPPITYRELQLRSLISSYWIWLTYLLLDGANVLLSIFFVCVLRIDAPGEWGPLFGSFLDASSLRGFWGKFWHRLAAPSCACSGRIITRRFAELAAHSGGEKVMIAFWTFFVSGVFHAVAEWQGGLPVFPLQEMQFWLTNFAAAAVETLIVTTWKRYFERSVFGRGPLSCLAYKLVGYTWIFVFFFWIVPKWQYPKLLAALEPGQRVIINTEEPNIFLNLLIENVARVSTI